MSNSSSTFTVQSTTKPLDSLAEALLARAIQNKALTPSEARTLATWDLVTITEFLALRLREQGLISPHECRSMLDYASEESTAH